MNDPKSPKPGFRPGATAAGKPGAPTPAVRPAAPGFNPTRTASSSPTRPAAPAARPVRPGSPLPSAVAPAARSGPSGKVRHDERGNAVWEFIAQTSRICIEATSRLMKKLEAPELKVEDTHDKELRIVPDPKSGGGYDPYNQATKPPKPGRK
jgi:hypothetical protein